jgi:hypothetical protein
MPFAGLLILVSFAAGRLLIECFRFLLAMRYQICRTHEAAQPPLTHWTRGYLIGIIFGGGGG